MIISSFTPIKLFYSKINIHSSNGDTEALARKQRSQNTFDQFVFYEIETLNLNQFLLIIKVLFMPLKRKLKTEFFQ